MFRWFLQACAAFSWVLLPACTTLETQEQTNNEVIVHPEPDKDDDYANALEAATRQVKVYDQFETKYLVNTTYLSPQFRKAFDERMQKLMGVSAFVLAEDRNKSGFFISIFAPDEPMLDLNNQNLWTILMEAGGQKHYPILVKSLAEKERWSPFFPYINKWTKEYFVMFDTPSFTPHAPAMVEQQAVTFTLANPDASVVLRW